MKPKSNPFHRSVALASVVTVFAVAPQQAHAANGVWGADADGAWATSGSWSGGTVPGATSGSNSDTATFDGAGDYVVSLGGGSVARHIGTINITNTGTTTFNNGGYLYLYDALTMAATAGAVDLGGNFRFNGTTNTVTNNSSELLTISAATSRTVSGGGTVTITGSGDTTISGAITNNASFGNLSFVKEGSGVLTLSGNNTYTGTTSITAGKLIAGHNAALGSTAAGTSVSGTGILDINNKNLGTEIITISGTGDGNGALVNNGADQVNAIGRLVLGANASIGGTNRWDLRNSTPTLDMGGFTLTKTGLNYVGLVGVAVSNPGDIDVTSGQFSIQTSTTMGGSSANSITVRDGAILSSWQAANSIAWSLDMKNGSTLRSESAALSTNNTWAGPVTLENSGTVTVDALATMTISGDISGTGAAINKTGAGTLTLSGANSYSGTTTVSAGKLVLANTSVLPANNVVSASGTSGIEFATDSSLANTIRLFTSSGSTVTYTLNRATSGAAVNQSTGAAAMGNGTVNVVKGGNVSSGTPTLSFSGITLSGGSPGTVTLNPTTANISAGTVTAVATHAKTLELGGTSTGNEITGTISDGSSGAAVSVTKSGSGIWTLSGNNTYTGDTLISAGSLQLDAASAINGTTNISTSGTGNSALLLNDVTAGSGKSLTISGPGVLISSVGYGALSTATGNTSSEWQGDVTIATTTGTRIGTQSGALKVSGDIGETNAGSELIVKNLPDGVVVLSGANTFSGDIKMFGGSLRVGADTSVVGLGNIISGPLGKGSLVTANSGSVLSAEGATARTIYNPVTVSSSFVIGQSSTNTGKLTFAGATTLGGTRTLTVDSDAEFTGAIGESGSGYGLIKAGNGTLTLSNTNTYTGATTVSTGTLVIDGDNSGAAGAVSVASGATLAGIGTVGGATTISGTHAPGSSPGVQSFSSDLSYASTSIFEWDLASSATGTRGTDYDGVNVGGTLSGTTGATFRVVLGSGAFTETFWNSNQSWTDIFKANVDGSGSAIDIASVFSAIEWYEGATDMTSSTGTEGYFTISGSSLNWTAVPEPTSALVGLLIGAGLLRRRRVA